MSNDSVVSFSPHNVLVVVPHTDDIEFCAGGSIARWTQGGARVSYLILTDGSKGAENRDQAAHQTSAIRQDEQRRAAKVLRAQDVFFCDYQDCGLAVRNEVKRDIVRVIRRVRPDTVVTFDPTMVYSLSRNVINHTDHRAAGQATIDAVFPLARDYHAFPELADKEKLEPHKVETLLLINYDKANFYVDITDYLDAKLKALTVHTSQFSDMEQIKRLVRKNAKQDAQAGGLAAAFAEAFIRIDIPA
jgi:LmbE family N-acetylglucosaminyl deacetylase